MDRFQNGFENHDGVNVTDKRYMVDGSQPHEAHANAARLNAKFGADMDAFIRLHSLNYDLIAEVLNPLSLRSFLKNQGWCDEDILSYAILGAEESVLDASALDILGEYISRAWD